MEYWTALLLGLAGSLHCAGMCGPLVLALPPGSTPSQHLWGRVAHSMGRLTTYGLLGVAFGLIGQSFALAGWQQAVSIGLGLCLLVAVWGWRKPSLQFRFQRFDAWLRPTLARWLRRRTPGALWVVGLLNGLLPCGLVYAACAGAVVAGTAWQGLLYMLVFGLGTVPMLLGLALIGRFAHLAWRLRLQRLVPVSLGLVAGLLILRGLGLGVPYLSPKLGRAGTTPACHEPTGAASRLAPPASSPR
ncbi:MAG: sulfite exporter TauE/SafE family protein [Verrucomicrobia bacterium]|nr:sulfite exporter TauE/SafE family protein [Verrucomicrobiota bacterium]